jgi:predicted RNase H-like nuclease (RuvC/YqgF family)
MAKPIREMTVELHLPSNPYQEELRKATQRIAELEHENAALKRELQRVDPARQDEELLKSYHEG